MRILNPKTITAAMIQPGTNIPAVDASVGEVAWASGTDYAVGVRRVDGDYIYECIKPVTGAPANTLTPSSAAGGEYWYKDDQAPTNRMAPFDEYLFTKARRDGDVTYVLSPGFVNGVAVHGLEADTLTITATAGVGGADLMLPIEVDLWQQAFGLHEYLFGDLQRKTQHTVGGIGLHPEALLTITAARRDGVTSAAVGYISVGQWETFNASHGSQGAAQYGASAQPRRYSYFKQNDDGTYRRRRGLSSIDFSVQCVIDAREANRARAMLDKILDTPVAIETSELDVYAWLSTIGFVTGKISAPNWGLATIDFDIKGNV